MTGTPRDSDQDQIGLLRVGAEAFEVIAALYGRSFDDPWPAPSVRELLSTPLTWAILALDRESETPIGFVIARTVVDEGEILSIAIEPQNRRAGIGARLLAGTLDRMAEEGAVSVFLEVGTDNPGAMEFYLAAGFMTIGTRSNYYLRKDGSRHDALVMRKNLSIQQYDDC
ncbi:MAG: ribosomal protein S18-alanine N-acetyltransferase [Alphaproteobacteria bacterium]